MDRNRRPDESDTPAHVLESIERHMAAQNLSLSANGRMLATILALLKEQFQFGATEAEINAALTPVVERLEGAAADSPATTKP